MKNYEKPIVMLNSELAEGVYAASGATGGGYDIGETYSGNGVKEYSLSITNTSDEWVDSVTITVPLYGNVTAIYGTKVDIICVNNGNGTATISFNNHGNGVSPHGTVGSIPVRVEGTDDFGIR